MKNAFTALVLIVLVVSASSFGFGTAVLNEAARRSVAPSRGGNMVMRQRACDLLGKTANRKARVVTFSHKRIHKVQEVNLQWKRYFSEKLGLKVRLRLSTKGIKTVNKYGSIDAAAEKLGVDLTQFVRKDRLAQLVTTPQVEPAAAT